MSFLTYFARAFVAGEKVKDAIKVVKKLNEKGIMATLDVLGENVHDFKTAENAVSAYLELLDVIAREKINSHVSLKLTQMGLDIDYKFCLENIKRIANKAQENDNFVRIDMEGSNYTQKTIDLFKEIHRDFKNVGIVIQAYLKRSLEDVKELNKINAKIRLCKGAYKEPPEIAYKKMKEIRENFLNICKILFENGNYPAIATHDSYLINSVKKMAKEMGKPPQDFEFQMLFGIRPKTQEILAREGYRMRVYVPFGTHWLPYFYRRLRERKENVFFVVKNLFKR
ncbi:MAG: proline dehydrogenase family protein [Candidatus Aminicenantia bacterium]